MRHGTMVSLPLLALIVFAAMTQPISVAAFAVLGHHANPRLFTFSDLLLRLVEAGVRS